MIVYNLNPMQAIKQFGKDAFSSLKIRNYRLYFIGHVISNSGTWMQTVALGWLVLTLTDSGTALGIIVALQFIPLLLLGPWGGVIADRYDKRKLLYATQIAFAVLTLGISVLVYTGEIQIWMLYIFSFVHGLIRIIDNPVRQIFVSELVESEYVRNAVSLNSTAGNGARVIGPSIGGGLIATVGIAACFFFNAISYLAVVWMLMLMRKDEFHPVPQRERSKHELREGWAYIRETPLIRSTLLMMAFIGTFAYEFQVSLPLMADRVYFTDAEGYAALLAALGAGSVVGGLFAASRKTVVPHQLADLAIIFGICIVGSALMPTIHFALIGIFFVGFFSINLSALGNTMLQLESLPHMRGRVLAFWSMAMIGSTAVGGPIVGLIGEYFGGRWSLAIGGIVSILIALFVSGPLQKQRLYKLIPAWMQRIPPTNPNV